MSLPYRSGSVIDSWYPRSEWTRKNGCCLTPNEQLLSYIIARTSYIWWDDDDVCFVLAQYAYLVVFDFYSASSMKQQPVGNVAPLGHIIMIQQAFVLTLDAVCLVEKWQIPIL